MLTRRGSFRRGHASIIVFWGCFRDGFDGTNRCFSWQGCVATEASEGRVGDVKRRGTPGGGPIL
jgi:hypothetical protein